MLFNTLSIIYLDIIIVKSQPIKFDKSSNEKKISFNITKFLDIPFYIIYNIIHRLKYKYHKPKNEDSKLKKKKIQF